MTGFVGVRAGVSVQQLADSASSHGPTTFTYGKAETDLHRDRLAQLHADLHRVTGAKQLKNRLHLDLAAVDNTTREAEVERLSALGATMVSDHRVPDGRGWVTMADPEGNEFCVLRSNIERPDPNAHLVK